MGETETPSFEAENAGVIILGQVTPSDGYAGQVRFEQHVTFRYIYHFGEYGTEPATTIPFSREAWYIDGGSPFTEPGLTGDYSCNSGVCGFMLDAPGARLQMMNPTTYAPLIGYELYEEYRTYLLWYPSPGCRIPLTHVDWSWQVEANARYVGPSDPAGRGYPWEWSRGNWDTDPRPGVTRTVTEYYGSLDSAINQDPPQATKLIMTWQYR